MKKLLASALFLMAGMGMAASVVSANELITQNLKKIDARIQVKSISDAPVDGMHEVELKSGEVLYADDKGEYFLIGKLYQFTDKDGFVNLTEKKQSIYRKEQLDQVSDEEMVVYVPKGEIKATVNIFTDVDCPYCRKLHAEIPTLNEMGIQVNYLAFPRQGGGTATYRDMVSIWCANGADGRREAMDIAKTGGTLAAKTCEDPVLEQLALGQLVGVTGTPAIVFEDGKLVPGYVPAAQLAQMLNIK